MQREFRENLLGVSYLT